MSKIKEASVPVVSTPNEKIIMYVFVNSDLELSKGQIGSQVGHITGIITEKIIRSAYENFTGNPPEAYFRFQKWKNSGKVGIQITLKATTEQLHLLMNMPEAENMIDDIGGKRNCFTCVGFFPNLEKSDIGVIAEKYKLL